jgi:hypothetical protein
MNDLIVTSGSSGAFSDFMIVEEFRAISDTREKLVLYPPLLNKCYPFKMLHFNTKRTIAGSRQHRLISKMDIGMGNLYVKIQEVYATKKYTKPYCGNLERIQTGSNVEYYIRGVSYDRLTHSHHRYNPYAVIERHLATIEYPDKFIKDYEKFKSICPEKYLRPEVIIPLVKLAIDRNVEIRIMHIKKRALSWLELTDQLSLFREAIIAGIISKGDQGFDEYIDNWAKRLTAEVLSKSVLSKGKKNEHQSL